MIMEELNGLMEKDRELLDKIKNHIEHWKDVNGYDCPFDYEGLKHIMRIWKIQNDV